MTLKWVKENPFAAVLIAVFGVWLWTRSRGTTLVALVTQPRSAGGVENFSTCVGHKQIYLNSCDADEPTGTGDVNIDNKYGKTYISIIANLPYAMGGVFHSMWGAYNAFLVDSRSGKSINLGSLVRSGDRQHRLMTELAGDYSNYDRIDVYRQTEQYRPKRVLTGSITCQGNSSL